MFRSIFIFILYSNISIAAVPSVDGLFKNLNNQPVQENTAIVSGKVRTSNLGGEVDESKTTLFLKVIITERSGLGLDAFHIISTNSDFGQGHVKKKEMVDDLIGRTQKSGLNSQLLFSSIMSMLTMNNSKPLQNILKKSNQDYSSNKELVNLEKTKLLEQYLHFLKTNKDIDSFQNPVKPNNESEKNRVNELMNSRFYKNPGTVKLVKVGPDLNWHLKLENTDAFFENESLRLRKLKLNLNDQVITYELSNYILMDGVHEFPKIIKIAVEGKYESIFEIKDYSLKNDKEGKLRETIFGKTVKKSGKDQAPENVDHQDQEILPAFLQKI